MAAHTRLTVTLPRPPSPSRKARLKRTTAFRAVYRRGRWARGRTLSVGVLPNDLLISRIGLRTRRGIKGAVVRNRLKRQARALLSGTGFSVRRGLDMVIVLHPKRIPMKSEELEQELGSLCKQAQALS